MPSGSISVVRLNSTVALNLAMAKPSFRDCR